MTHASSATRSATGQFAPGHSGNPAGRPKGARNKATVLAEALREGESETLLRMMVELALAGNMTALRFCCERIAGKPRAASVELELPPGAESDPAAIFAAAIRAMADGEIAPDEAAVISRVATAARPVFQAEERKRRLAEFEAEARAEAEAAEPAAPAEADPAPAEAPETAEPAPEAADQSAASPVIRLYPGRDPATASGPASVAASPAETPEDATDPAIAAAAPVSGLYFGSAAPAPVRRDPPLRRSAGAGR